ncbi:MAG: PAS domain S-box protein, partial [Candidatus Eisenbacteria bacterium]|nr:PAS domain S-box protein [Candidatus Eisenbacteria bacterium]
MLSEVEVERDRISALVASVQDEVWFADTQRRFKLVNPAVMKEFALPRADGGMDIEEFVASLEVLRPDGTPRPVQEPPALRALAGEVLTNVEEYARTPSTGELRYRQASAAPVKDKAGRIIGSVTVVRDITEHKRAEEALRDGEARFRSVFESAPVGIVIGDLGGRVLDSNPAFAQMLGCTTEELCGKSFTEFTHAEDLAVERALVEEVLAGRRDHYQIDKRYVRKDGALLDVRFLGSYLGGRQSGRSLALVVDITERKRMEEALRETRDYLQSLIGYANAPIIVWDPGFRITEFNRAFERLSGRQAEEVLGRTLDILFPADRREESMAHIRRTAAGERWEVVEIPIQHADGSVRTVLWNSATILSPDGKTATATIAQGQDITERKQAEEALRATHERLKKVLEVETVGVMFWDLRTGRMTDANETFLKLMGYSRQEVEAGELTWQRLTPPEYVEASLAEIEKFKTSGRIGPYEKEYFHKDGTRQWLVFAGSALDGDVCVEFCVDISDRTMAEDALREANLQLAEADRRKNEFLAVLSHELRNPLAPIANGLYIL